MQFSTLALVSLNFILWLYVLLNLDNDCINSESLGLTQSNLMDLYLLSRSVVGVKLYFDNSKDSCEGS